jgi:hypothetical protein
MQRALRRWPRAVLCAAAVSPVVVSAPSTLEEPWTKQSFPLELGLDRGLRAHLAGVALRCMMNWCWLSKARAYAFALYLDAAAVDAVRTAQRAGAADPLGTALDAQASAPRGTFVLRLCPSRAIEGGHMAHGFRHQRAWAAQRAQVPLPPPGASFPPLPFPFPPQWPIGWTGRGRPHQRLRRR